jgi:hypothetical protein
VGSPVRIAAAACLVASGLLVGGAGASIAFADPAHSGGGGGKHTNGSSGDEVFEKPKSDPEDKKTTPGADGKDDQTGTDPVDPKPEDDDKDGDGKNGDNNNGDNGVGNPGTGNCGNSGGNGGGNGGARGCGGGGNPPPTPTTRPSTPPEEEPPPEEPGNCEEENKDDCSPGWPWWPWPWPWDPGQPPGGGGGGGGTAPEVPSGRPGPPPQMQLPPELMPPASEPPGPSVIDSVPGVGVAAELPIPPITLPVIVAPAIGVGGGSPGAPNAPVLPGTPRGATAEPPAGREPLPANVGSNIAVPASSYRIGYTDYLRSAGLSQVAALAVPGVAGMLVLTGAGGLVGYRQAKAGHAVHTNGTARFVN